MEIPLAGALSSSLSQGDRTTCASLMQVLVPKDHVSRSPNDTYYVDENTVLRCHTSAHQAGLLQVSACHTHNSCGKNQSAGDQIQAAATPRVANSRTTHWCVCVRVCVQEGHRKFLCIGDVYRRDTIDATHYPAFHQMEGVRVFEKEEWQAAGCTDVQVRVDNSIHRHAV
jgi:phenylalanyl-tRNA synthetase alpha chain